MNFREERADLMANIRPFNAFRPKKGMEDTIAALPYDVYNREEAKKVFEGRVI